MRQNVDADGFAGFAAKDGFCFNLCGRKRFLEERDRLGVNRYLKDIAMGIELRLQG